MPSLASTVATEKNIILLDSQLCWHQGFVLLTPYQLWVRLGLVQDHQRGGNTESERFPLTSVVYLPRRPHSSWTSQSEICRVFQLVWYRFVYVSSLPLSTFTCDDDLNGKRWSTFMVLNKAQVEPKAGKGSTKGSPGVTRRWMLLPKVQSADRYSN